MHIYQKDDREGVNYIDDMASAQKKGEADAAFEGMGRVLSEIGVLESLRQVHQERE